MYRRELELARRQGELLLQEIDRATARVAELEEVVRHAGIALDHGWRMQSALGEFISLDDTKARFTGFIESKAPATQAFALVKEVLVGGEQAIKRSEAQVLEYLQGLKGRISDAQGYVGEALAKSPSAEDWQFDIKKHLPRAAEGPMATVVIRHDPQRARSFEEVRNLVAAALDPLGGIGAFVKPGQTVLIKPNLTLFFLAEEGVSTDPRVVAALVRLAKDAGASRVMVGESSGGGTATKEAFDITGVGDAARREGAELVDFHTCEQAMTDIGGKIIDQMLLPAPLIEADVLINAPKAKTHHMDLISGAIKNWVGVLRPDVRSAHHDANTYQEYVDIMRAVRPTLNVVDAIYIGEGDGPGATTGRFYGGIIASADPVATDATVAMLMGFDPRQVAFVQLAQEGGIGVGDPSRIDLAGASLDEAYIGAKPPRLGVDYFNANVIVGTGISRPGTLDHFKSSADIWLKMGVWKAIERLKGRPTIMIGNAEDPLFDRHLREGPYIVIDDAAQEKYKHHPNVTFIPGHPALHNILPQLMEGLGVPTFGQISFGVMKKVRNLESYLEFSGTPAAPLSTLPAAFRSLPLVAQYGAMGATIATLALGLLWLGFGFIGGLKRRVPGTTRLGKLLQRRC